MVAKAIESQSDSTRLCEVSASVLAELANGTTEVLQAVVEPCCLKLLVTQASAGTAAGKDWAALALKRLACSNGDFKDDIIAAGAVEPLVVLCNLQSSTSRSALK